MTVSSSCLSARTSTKADLETLRHINITDFSSVVPSSLFFSSYIHDSLNAVVGFRSLYRYAGAPASGGVFTYQNTSAQAPGHTLTVRLQISPLD